MEKSLSETGSGFEQQNRELHGDADDGNTEVIAVMGTAFTVVLVPMGAVMELAVKPR